MGLLQIGDPVKEMDRCGVEMIVSQCYVLYMEQISHFDYHQKRYEYF